MNRFKHINAFTLQEAESLLAEYGPRARLIAGGTDLLGGLRDDIWPEPPEVIINLKPIPELNRIVEEKDGLRLGALATLNEVAASEVMNKDYLALAQAARKTASPLLRNLGTLAGNICQENRCWYYRYPEKLGGRIDCLRKGGRKCEAIGGDSRYHSIFGAVNRCIAVNPGDTAPALIVLGAEVITTQRVIGIGEFFSAENGPGSTVLGGEEIVTGIRLPAPDPRAVSAFTKISLRKTIDFAIVNCAVNLVLDQGLVSEVKICLNAVYNNPYRAGEAEEFILGKEVNPTTAREAGAAISARPLPDNRYKVRMAEAVIAQTLEACKP